MRFPEVVQRLQAEGVERYHVDYCRMRKTHYLPNGETHEIAIALPGGAVAKGFFAPGIEAALRRVQRGETDYAGFVRETMAAGCVGYSVHISGRCALYFGRNGEVHHEPFPTARN
jgi:uncharacterized protein YbcV (DUF1398 family)